MKLFVTSDQHFTHRNIIKYAQRPFELSDAGISECINTIVNRHNEIVTDDDIVLFVGDLAHGRNYSEQDITLIVGAMKGKKILIRGNHDHFSDEFYRTLFVDVVDHFLIDDTLICHYPCYESKFNSIPEREFIDKFSGKFTRIIHGHVHNKDPSEWESDGVERINACVDFTPNNFYPVNINIGILKTYFDEQYGGK